MIVSSVDRAELPVIRLDSCVGTALVISHPTGVIYVNQAGGTACMQPGMEGAVVPFGNDVALEGNVLMSAQDALEKHFTGSKHLGSGATSGLDDEDADVIDGIFAGAHVGPWFKVDRGRLKESMEAWVYVTITEEENDGHLPIGLFAGFAPYPRAAVLTWMNSD